MASRPVTTGVIEYCLSNVSEGTRRRLAGREDAVEAPCLEHCGICRQGPFLIVDGELIRGEGKCANVIGTPRERRTADTGGGSR